MLVAGSVGIVMLVAGSVVGPSSPRKRYLPSLDGLLGRTCFVPIS